MLCHKEVHTSMDEHANVNTTENSVTQRCFFTMSHSVKTNSHTESGMCEFSAERDPSAVNSFS